MSNFINHSLLGMRVPMSRQNEVGDVHFLKYPGTAKGSSCFVVQDDDGLSGGGGASPRPAVKMELPRVSLHTGQTPTSQALRATLKRVPLKVINVYGPNKSGAGFNPQVSGRLYVAGHGAKNANITSVPAHITVVPQWHADETNGGGATGGVAQAWNNTVSRLRSAEKSEDADALGSALDRYGDVRDTTIDKVLPPGSYVRSDTGITDATVAPAHIVHIVSVPSPNYRLSSGAASQYDRMNYMEFVWKEALKGVKVSVEKNGLQPSPDHPIRVSIPALGTGPDGAVTYEEAAVIMLRVLGQFMQENPGYEFIIPLHNGSYESVDRATGIENFIKILSGDANALKEVKNIYYNAPRNIFNMMMDPFRTPAPQGKGEDFDEDYFSERFSTWSERITSALGNIPSGTIDGARPVAEQFTTAADTALATFLYKSVALSHSQIEDGHFKEVKPNPRMLKQALKDPQLKKEIFAHIRAKLGDFGESVEESFAGDAKMGDIISAAAATILHQRVLNRVGEFHTEFLALINQLEGVLEGLQGEATQLQRQMREANMQIARLGAGASEQADGLREQVNSLSRQLQKREKEIASLTARLQSASTTSSKVTATWGRSG